MMTKYSENRRLYEPLTHADNMDLTMIPKDLISVLKDSNGIMETMLNPYTKEIEEIGWIIMPLSEILETTKFYQEEYSIDGFVFSDDGAGNPYYIKKDNKIYQFECIDGQESVVCNSLQEFLES